MHDVEQASSPVPGRLGLSPPKTTPQLDKTTGWSLFYIALWRIKQMSQGRPDIVSGEQALASYLPKASAIWSAFSAAPFNS
jgi:hypothetical protein